MSRPTLGRVFVVDDEISISDSLAAILRLVGFAASAFSNPLNALEAGWSDPPDLLISDVVMPQFSGVELALRMKVRHPQCKILLFSGQTNTEDLLKNARALGYDFRLLAKPIHPKELLRQIGKEDARWIVSSQHP